VYVWADGSYVKAGLEKDKAAMLVVIAGLRDGRKVVLAVESGYRESTDVSADGRNPENAEIGSPPTPSDNVPSPIAIGRRDRCWDWRTS
jgi:hypothetical protein